MAKPKLQTSKKRVNKKEEELKAPDEVTTALHKLSEHLSKYLKYYALGLAGILVVALAISWMLNSRQKAAAEESAAVMTAVGTINGSVATYAETEKFFSLSPEGQEAPKTDFEDEKARWTAVGKALDSAKDSVDGDTEVLLNVVAGRAALGAGDMKAAADAFNAYASEAEDSSLMPIVLENQGRAAEEQQQVAEAAGFYEKLAGLPDLYYQVRGAMLLGDLYNPKGGAGKDKAKAEQYYTKALDALTPAEGQVLTASLRALRGEISRRKAQL